LRAIIVANGDLVEPETYQLDLEQIDIIIAADGGTQHCRSLSLEPSVVIGDLDSINFEEQLAINENDNIQLVVYPREKDQTDLELALQYAKKIGVTELFLIGLFGGRIDQTIANILLLTREEWSDIDMVVLNGAETAYLMRESRSLTLSGKVGDIVSLIPLSPIVSVAKTDGLRWQLNDTEMFFGTTLGISNEMIKDYCQIHIGAGNLLVIHTNVL
jgi:thiamine pyrophosphokinase